MQKILKSTAERSNKGHRSLNGISVVCAHRRWHLT
jgi:hypothetical protein